MSTFIFYFFKIGKDASTAIIKNSFFIFFIYSIVFSKLSPVPSTRMSSDTELYNFDKGIELFIEDKFFIKERRSYEKSDLQKSIRYGNGYAR